MDPLKTTFQLMALVLLAIPAQAGDLLSALTLQSADSDGIATVTAVPGKQQHVLLSVNEPPISVRSRRSRRRDSLATPASVTLLRQ